MKRFLEGFFIADRKDNIIEWRTCRTEYFKDLKTEGYG